jgi:DNA-directed RNA polymerase beta' subunit
MNGKIEETTVGRVLFSDVLPESMSFSSVNKEMNKKELAKLIDECYRKLGLRRTVVLIDDLKEIGFKFAMRAGISICISDMHIPSKKQKFIDQAQKEVMEIHHQYTEGLITNGERYNKEIDIWANVTEKIADEMMAELGMEEIELRGGKSRKYRKPGRSITFL